MPATPIARDQWTGLGFLLAAIGSAVGIGNIWRFPYMVGINGGGAFLIPYLVGVAIFSLPLMIMELDAGRHFRGSVLTVLKRIRPEYRLAGLLPVFVSLGVAGYYFVITGWSLAYFVFSFTGYVGFQEFVSGPLPLAFFLATLAVTALTISMGIKKGIERLAIVMMPLFALLLLGLAAYSMTLPGAAQGLDFYLRPDFGYLSDVGIWAMGIVQAFFSLAVGYGILLTYSSYLDRKQSVTRYALGIAGADTAIALIGGLIVFPIVFTYRLDPAMGSGLTFLSLPLVFQSIPMGFVVGAAFFLLLFVAGLTSAVGFFEVGASSLVDELSWSRSRSALVISLMIMIVGVPASLTFFGPGIYVSGVPLMEFLDQSFGSLLLVSASILSILITRHFVPGAFSGKGTRRITFLFLRYAVPAVLMVIFCLNLLGV